MSDVIDPADRGAYRHWYQEKVRFSDTDMIGHVNNVAFVALIESGRVNFTRSGVIENLPPDMLVVMRRIELDYRAELHWPAEVDVGSRLLRLGNTSFSVGNGVFDGERCVATSVTTLVVIDKNTRRPAPIPDMVRAGMAEYVTS